MATKTIVDTANHVAAYAAQSARAQVIPAYPITPQTQIIELIADLVDSGEMSCHYIPVESEHSVMAACIGAAAVGARTFTASSSHGVAYMHEMLHWASGARLPIVMAVVNRAMGPPWNIMPDMGDSLSQRDTGWLQFYCASHQEIFDTILHAYRICEDRRVLLPAMVCFEGFILSHTQMPFIIPDQAAVDSFLPPYRPGWRLDVDYPISHSTLASPDYYTELRYVIQDAMKSAADLIPIVDSEFADKVGLPRHGGLVEEMACEDAEIVIVCMGSIGSEAKLAVEAMRERGHRVGLARVRVFRPFPSNEIKRAMSGAEAVAVIDRALSFGMEGQLFTEAKASLYDLDHRPAITGFITGIGGRDVTRTDIEEMALKALENARAGKSYQRLIWPQLRAE